MRALLADDRSGKRSDRDRIDNTSMRALIAGDRSNKHAGQRDRDGGRQRSRERRSPVQSSKQQAYARESEKPSSGRERAQATRDGRGGGGMRDLHRARSPVRGKERHSSSSEEAHRPSKPSGRSADFESAVRACEGSDIRIEKRDVRSPEPVRDRKVTSNAPPASQSGVGSDGSNFLSQWINAMEDDGGSGSGADECDKKSDRESSPEVESVGRVDPSVFEMRKNQFLRSAAINSKEDVFEEAPKKPAEKPKVDTTKAVTSAFGRNMFQPTVLQKANLKKKAAEQKKASKKSELEDVMDSFMKEHVTEADETTEERQDSAKFQSDSGETFKRDIFPEMGPIMPVETYRAPGGKLEERVLHIPTWQMGIIVGKAGESIEALRQASRSQIRVGEVGQDPMGPELQSIFIIGNCDLAEQMIFEKLKERNPHLFPVAPTAQTPTVPQTGVFARDWTCPGCSFNVFASREICYKCGTARPAGGGPMLTPVVAPPPADHPCNPAYKKVCAERLHWMCRKCANMNHNSRPACNYCKTYRPGYEPTRESQLLLRPAPWD